MTIVSTDHTLHLHGKNLTVFRTIRQQSHAFWYSDLQIFASDALTMQIWIPRAIVL